MKYRWSFHPPQPALAELLARELSISALLAQCLLNRGLSEPVPAARFLDPRLKHLSDPFLLPNMTTAVDRLFAARERREPLAIFGDYDVDGVSTTALLLEVLSRLGWQVNAYLPHRMDEGYGLTRDGVENCLQKFPVNLILAVDCGSTAVETVAWLRGRGVDVIVLDHHQVGDPRPAAVALVNPQLAPLGEPSFRELCSVGLAFKLAHALVKRGRELDLPEAQTFDLKPLLDLVALGTVADLVPLTGENRILASMGLARLEESQRPGILALREVAGVQQRIGSYEVGFQLAPRLNAAGRLETAAEALQLLMAPDLATATPIAQSLNSRNRERQDIERGIAEEVIGAVKARFNPERDFVIIEGQLLWHIGVVGIVASRVLQQFYRPTLIFGGDGHAWRGSGRSIEGFDLAAALCECDDLLLRHGGHAMAAGVTLDPTKLDAFRERLNSVARRSLRPEQLQPFLRLDGEVPLRELTLERVTELDRLKPTGQGNRVVLAAVRGLGHERALQRMGVERQHVKMWVTDGRATVEAVWWGAGNESLPVGRFDLACTPQINDYNGRRSVQLKVVDWRPA
jgi:single-stranded-DNA-specific exonuclease